PTIAPNAAPPPAPTAVRLPRPFPTSSNSLVCIGYRVPLMCTESITSWGKALPLNLPADCAVTTVPPTFVPTGKTTRCPLVRGTASEAAKGSPLFADCEFTVWSSVTVIVVPAGITTGGSGGGGAGAAAAGAVAGAAALLADEF